MRPWISPRGFGAGWSGSLIVTGSALILALACSGERRVPAGSPERLSSIAATAGVTLPPSARLVFEDTTTRGANTEDAGLWIIAIPSTPSQGFATGSSFVLPGERVTVPAATVRANIVTNVPDLALGTNSGPDAFVNDWTHESSRWRGTTLATDKGMYLLLERSKL